MVNWFIFLISSVIFVICFQRASNRGQLGSRSAWITWGIFVCAWIAFALRLPVIQAFLSERFGDVPVFFWLKAAVVMIAFELYSIGLRRAQSPQRRPYHSLHGLAPLAIVFNSGVVILAMQGHLDAFQAYFSMKAFTDLVTLPYMLLMVVPVNYALFFYEELDAMRFKHAILFTLWSVYTIGALLTVVFSSLGLVTGQTYAIIDDFPTGQLAFVALLILLIPHRYTLRLLALEQVYLYTRLHRLEREIMQITERTSQLPRFVNPFNLRAIEEATYVAVITLIDYSRDAGQKSVRGRVLAERIKSAAPTEVDLAQVVRAMAYLQ